MSRRMVIECIVPRQIDGSAYQCVVGIAYQQRDGSFDVHDILNGGVHNRASKHRAKRKLERLALSVPWL
jgi:hypothetical protein